MSAREIVALCILWHFFHLSSCSIAYMKYSKLKAVNWGLPLAGHKLNATPIATSRVANHIKCMTQCGKTEGCVAINLGPSQGGERKCEMLDTTRYSISNVNFTAQAGWTYVGPKTKCDANPCPKGLLCIPQEHADDYTCLDLSEESCRAPLGMESGEILDSAIIASSVYSPKLHTSFARLNKHLGSCAWTPLTAKKYNAWIQVDLSGITAVVGVATQGRCDVRVLQWVKSYTVSYSTDSRNWKFYEESGNEKIFTGNFDRTTVVTHYFQTPVSARYVRLWPQSFEGLCSMRMELYGCRIEN